MSIFKPKTLIPNVQLPQPTKPQTNNDPKWLEIAKIELGQAEVPGNEDNPRIVEYFEHTTLGPSQDSVPWCSAFVNFCMDLSGYKGTKSASARSWLKWGKELKSFKRGAIVVFKRGNNPALGHVGFALRDLGNELEVLSGNSNNMVRISRYPKADLLAYRWPGLFT